MKKEVNDGPRGGDTLAGYRAVHRRGACRSVLPFPGHLLIASFSEEFDHKRSLAVATSERDTPWLATISARDKFLKSHSGLNRVKERTVVVLTDRW